MKTAFVGLLLLIASCASSLGCGLLPDAAEEIKAVEGSLDKALDQTKEALALARPGGEALCAAVPASCQELADALAYAEGAIEDAESAYDDYRAARHGYETAASAVQNAIDAVAEYLRTIDGIRRKIT